MQSFLCSHCAEKIDAYGANSASKILLIFLTVAWRSLWRNKRRTVLTCCALAFATMLIQIGMSFQAGGYQPMIEVGTRLGSGHIQLLHPKFQEEPRIERTISISTDFREQLFSIKNVQGIAQRTESFILLNKGEKSYSALLVGVEPKQEQLLSFLPQHLIEGSYLSNPNGAFLGQSLARNLDATLGDEIVVLGIDAHGSIAASVLTLEGIYRSNNDQLDRSVVHVHHELFDELFNLNNSVHRVVLNVDNPMQTQLVERALSKSLDENIKLATWRELMPELHQSIQLDKISNGIIYGVLTVIVVLSIANTFVMSMIERTREYGTLLAIGMKRRLIFGVFATESLCLWCVGIVFGTMLGSLVIIPLNYIGISLGSMELEHLSGQWYLPDRIFPQYDLLVLFVAPVALAAGVAVATLFAMLRLLRMPVLQAIRFRE